MIQIIPLVYLIKVCSIITQNYGNHLNAMEPGEKCAEMIPMMKYGEWTSMGPI